MKRVFQTVFGAPQGNCQAACIASIFDLNIEAVPDDTSAEWGAREGMQADWLRDRGFQWLTFPGPLPKGIRGYMIGAVRSQKYDCQHAVVVLDGAIVHDPNPTNEPYPSDVEILQFTAFLALDPARAYTSAEVSNEVRD